MSIPSPLNDDWCELEALPETLKGTGCEALILRRLMRGDCG